MPGENLSGVSLSRFWGPRDAKGGTGLVARRSDFDRLSRRRMSRAAVPPGEPKAAARLNLVHARKGRLVERRRVPRLASALCGARRLEVWVERRRHATVAKARTADRPRTSSAGRVAIVACALSLRSFPLWPLRGDVASNGGSKGLTPGFGAWLFPLRRPRAAGPGCENRENCGNCNKP